MPPGKPSIGNSGLSLGRDSTWTATQPAQGWAFRKSGGAPYKTTERAQLRGPLQAHPGLGEEVAWEERESWTSLGKGRSVMGADEAAETAQDGDLGEETREQVEEMEGQSQESFSWRFIHFNIHLGVLGPVLDFSVYTWSLHPQPRCPI